MAEATVSIVVKAVDNASKTLQDINKSLAPIGLSVTKIGAAMMGMGVAMAAGLGMAVKSAEAERVGIMRLDAQLKNVGVSYDKVKVSLEGVIRATMLKTGVADDEQRDAISKLLLVTNDYNKALKLLPLTLDLAAAGEIDAGTAATYLGKAMLELEGGAEKVSIRLGRTTLEFKNLDELMKRVGGTAEKMVSPMKVMGNLLQDLSEIIGEQLLPTVNSIVGGLNNFLVGLQGTNPELLRFATNAGAVSAAILILGGGFLTLVGQFQRFALILPAIIGFLGSPAGIAVVAVAAGLAISGLAMYLNQAQRAAETANRDLRATSDTVTAIGKNADFSAEGIKRSTDALNALNDATNKAGETGSRFTRILAYSIEITNGAKVKTALYTEEQIKAEQELGKLVQRYYPLIDAVNAYDDAQEEAKRKTKELADETKALEEQFAALMGQIEYTGSDAQKFSVTMIDIYDAMLALGYSQDVIREKFILWGFEIGNVDDALFALGLTAERVANSIESNFRRAARSLADIEKELGGLGAGDRRREELILEYQRRKYYPKLYGYQHGGTVQETGLAMVHKGETVIPEAAGMGGVVVNIAGPNFLDNEQALNKLARKIYDSIKQSQRLQFGNAYSGA